MPHGATKTRWSLCKPVTATTSFCFSTIVDSPRTSTSVAHGRSRGFTPNSQFALKQQCLQRQKTQMRTTPLPRPCRCHSGKIQQLRVQTRAAKMERHSAKSRWLQLDVSSAGLPTLIYGPSRTGVSQSSGWEGCAASNFLSNREGRPRVSVKCRQQRVRRLCGRSQVLTLSPRERKGGTAGNPVKGSDTCAPLKEVDGNRTYFVLHETGTLPPRE